MRLLGLDRVKGFQIRVWVFITFLTGVCRDSMDSYGFIRLTLRGYPKGPGTQSSLTPQNPNLQDCSPKLRS